MKTVVCRLDLGQTRIAGYTLFDDVTKQFNETTPKEVLRLTRRNQVQGLRVVKKVEFNQDNYYIEPDLENFNQHELLIKSAVGKFRTLNGSDINHMYAVAKHYVVEDSKEQYFEVVSNQCSRIIVNQDVMEAMVKIVAIAGIRVKQSTDENGEPEELCEILCESETIKSNEINSKLSELVVYELGAILNEMVRRKNDLDKADKIRELIEKETINDNNSTEIEPKTLEELFGNAVAEDTSNAEKAAAQVENVFKEIAKDEAVKTFTSAVKKNTKTRR